MLLLSEMIDCFFVLPLLFLSIVDCLIYIAISYQVERLSSLKKAL